MNTTQHTHTFEVIGMRCGHCEAAVSNAIIERDAQAHIKIDRSQGPLAKVEIVSHLDTQSLRDLIESEGYQLAH